MLHFSQYGCTYSEWLSGVEPRPMEELCCPYLYYNKGIGSEPLEKCHIDFGSRIYDCKHYKDKAECWKEYHKNNGYALAELLVTFMIILVVLAFYLPTLFSDLKDKEEPKIDRLDEFNKTVTIKEETPASRECTSFTIEVRNGNMKVRCE